MKRTILAVALATIAFASRPADMEKLQLARQNIERAMALTDASWEKSIKGTDTNLWLADKYHTTAKFSTGKADVWPYTAAIEAHCSVLEALERIKDSEPDFYQQHAALYKDRLAKLIDNLEYYKGSYTLPSYAVNRKVSPYAVPRADKRGEANVTGILNVYDDQMWLARELVRAYRLTDNESYLEIATELTDYVLEGWDCWRDADGNEYGGITWGPGYNSKHACSNAPIIQPLVWLSDIYSSRDDEMKYYYRDEEGARKTETVKRGSLYLEFARKVYAWQKKKLMDSRGLYWDMMGADGKILVSRGYRQHVDCGAPGGNFYSYNTGTMIAGAAELYRVTKESTYLDDLTKTIGSSLNVFSKYLRSHKTYEFKTDETAENGFNTWFNNVLMRSYIVSVPYEESNTVRGLKSFQYNLDYAFENHNRDNMLPIHLIDGWGDEVYTKAFHQFAFASEYAMLAIWHIDAYEAAAIDDITGDSVTENDDVYNLSGVKLGRLDEIRSTLPRGIYIVGGRKMLIGEAR